MIGAISSSRATLAACSGDMAFLLCRWAKIACFVVDRAFARASPCPLPVVISNFAATRSSHWFVVGIMFFILSD